MTMTSLDDELTRQLMHQRIVVLGEALEEGNGNRLMHQLLLLSAEDKRADISLWINSPGGSVSAMLAIRDVMRLIPNDVATLAMGMAASAGQFLLSAGTPGKRHALPHARILLHQGSAGIGGTAMDIEIQAKDLRYTRDTVLALVSEDTGQPVEIIERDSRRDRWFSAQEAMDYGFVDQVVSSVDDVAPSGGRTLVGLGVATMSTYTIPYVVQQTPRGERTVDLYSRLLSDRIIYLGTEIDDGVANAVIAQLLHLASEAPSTPISLYINSPGGSITAMLAIYDAMQFVSSPVETTCVGQAAWTAAVLLAGGEPGRRQMLPHARVVLHQPAMSAARHHPRPDRRGRRGGPGPGAAGGDPRPPHRPYGRPGPRGHRPRPRPPRPGRRRLRHRRQRPQPPGAGRDVRFPAGRWNLHLACLPSRAKFSEPTPGTRGQAARQRAPYGAGLRATRTESWRTVRPRAPATADRISDEGSLRPRSTSERYCVETPARSATSVSRSPRSWRSVRSSRPTSSRQSGSVAAGLADGLAVGTLQRQHLTHAATVGRGPAGRRAVLLWAE